MNLGLLFTLLLLTIGLVVLPLGALLYYKTHDDVFATFMVLGGFALAFSVVGMIAVSSYRPDEVCPSGSSFVSVQQIGTSTTSRVCMTPEDAANYSRMILDYKLHSTK